jgi:hypothetical protein
MLQEPKFHRFAFNYPPEHVFHYVWPIDIWFASESPASDGPIRDKLGSILKLLWYQNFRNLEHTESHPISPDASDPIPRFLISLIWGQFHHPSSSAGPRQRKK